MDFIVPSIIIMVLIFIFLRIHESYAKSYNETIEGLKKQYDSSNSLYFSLKEKYDELNKKHKELNEKYKELYQSYNDTWEGIVETNEITKIINAINKIVKQNGDCLSEATYVDMLIKKFNRDLGPDGEELLLFLADNEYGEYYIRAKDLGHDMTRPAISMKILREYTIEKREAWRVFKKLEKFCFIETGYIKQGPFNNSREEHWLVLTDKARFYLENRNPENELKKPKIQSSEVLGEMVPGSLLI